MAMGHGLWLNMLKFYGFEAGGGGGVGVSGEIIYSSPSIRKKQLVVNKVLNIYHFIKGCLFWLFYTM